MRSDTKALLKLFGMSFVMVVLVLGLGLVAFVCGLAKETSVYLMFGCFVVGEVVIIWISSRRLYSAMLLPQPRKAKPTEPFARPDDGEE